MGRDQRLLSDAYFHGLLVDPKDESSSGFPCLYRITRPAGTSLDDLWLVWIGKCFYRKPRTQVVYRDWDLAFATYWRDVNFNAAADERPRYPNKELLRRAAIRFAKALQETLSDFSKLRAATRVSFLKYVEPWDASIPMVQDGRSSSESSSASDEKG